MKKTLKRILICILICLMINNFFFSNMVFASSGDDAISTFVTGLLGTVVGLLTWPVRLVALAAGLAMDTLTAGVAYSQGSVDENGDIVADTFFGNNRITPFDILFNKVALTDVNFFNIGDEESIIGSIRVSIAAWYYVMRNFASAILLCVLIYVGIRMAISTVASDKAVYKKMLVDWACSLALIFLLQYIIIFTFSVNNAFISSLSSIGEQGDLDGAITEIATKALGASVDAIAATVVYCMIVAQTLGLFISYFNRMLKLAFLVIISPLITLTYSMDKMGDGKAQALGTWLKEFVYTVLIQPFHCVVYLVFIKMSLEVLSAGPANSIAGGILAILCIRFTKDAEKILGKIFKFGDHASDASIGVGMAASAMALSKAKSFGKNTRTAINGLKGAKGRFKEKTRQAKVDALTAKNFFSKNEDGKKMSLAEARAAAEVSVATDEAKKLEEKNKSNYEVIQNNGAKDDAEKEKFDKISEMSPAEKEAEISKMSEGEKTRFKNHEYQKRVEQATAVNVAAGMSQASAAAHARAQVAKETRQEQKDENFKKKYPKISAAKGTISRVKEFANNSQTLKELGEMGKKTMAAGLGTFAGSAMYGSGKDAFTSIATGTAVYKGTNEYMKNSSKTLSNNVSQLLQGAGMQNATQAAGHINEIMANADNYEDAKKYLDDLFKKLDSALKGLDSNEKSHLKSSIKNVIQREIQKNPNATNDDILGAIFKDTSCKNLLGKTGITAETIKNNPNGIESEVLTGMVTFNRDKAIYDTIKQAGNIGVGPDTFIEQSIETFRSDSYGHMDDNSPTNNEALTEVIENPTRAIGEMEAEELSTDERDRLVEEARTRLDEMEQLMTQHVERGEDVPEKLQTAHDILQESYQNLYDASLQKEVERLDSELENYKSIERDRLSREAQQFIDAKVQELNEELQKAKVAYDTSIREQYSEMVEQIKENNKMLRGKYNYEDESGHTVEFLTDADKTELKEENKRLKRNIEELRDKAMRNLESQESSTDAAAKTAEINRRLASMSNKRWQRR